MAIASVTLLLPTNGPANVYIADRLQFRERIPPIFGEHLISNWGEPQAGGRFRLNTHCSQAPTWREACEKARAYGTQQLQILEDALAARARALAGMECPENRPHAAKPGRARPIHLPKHEKETENANV